MVDEPGRPGLPPKFDVFAMAARDDPNPGYAQLRDAGPVCRVGPGQWAVTRHREVAALLRDERLSQFQFAEAYRLLPAAARPLTLPDGPANSFTRQSVVALDRPDHTPVRRLLTKALLPMLSGFEVRVGELADALFDAAEDAGTLDAIGDLAHPLPFQVLCELLGIAEADRTDLGAEAMELARAFAVVVPDRTTQAADRAVQRLRGYFADRLAHTRTAHTRSLPNPPGSGDLLARMVAHNSQGVPDELLVDNAIFLILAGLETSINLLGGGALALANHPAQVAALRTEPAGLSTAVEELLRFDAPTRMTARLSTEAIVVSGHRISSGRVVLLLIGSANHDERVFAAPERLDLTRRPNPHVSFGSGVHHCVGAALARLEASVVFDRLIRRFALIEPAGTHTRDSSTGQRSYSSIPLRVVPAGGR